MKKKIINIVFWVVLLISLIVVANNFYERYKGKQELESKLQVPNQSSSDNNKSAAPDFTLNNLQGKLVKLSDYKGKIVVLNFWATWCPPCRSELPDFNKASEEFSKSNDVVILAVNSTNGYNGETVDKVKKFVEENKLTMNILLDTKDEASSKYGITNLPTTFIIDRSGKVYGYHMGTMSYMDLLKAIKEIQ